MPDLDLNEWVGVIGVLVGIAGLVFGWANLSRTRKTHHMIAVNLAKMSGTTHRLKESAGWAYARLNETREFLDTLRNSLEGQEAIDKWNEASKAVQLGGGDATAAKRAAHELKREVHSLQHALFGRAKQLGSGGKMKDLHSDSDATD